MLLVVLVVIQGLILSILMVIPRVASSSVVRDIRITYPDSVLGIVLSPNPANSGARVQVSGRLSLPYDSVIQELHCGISSNLNIFQGQPICTLNSDGSILGSFQVNPSALAGDYTIIIVLAFSPNYPYSPYWNCTESVTTTTAGEYGYVTTILGYGCYVEDTTTLTIWSPCPPSTTTVVMSKTIIQSSTITKVKEVSSQLPPAEAIAIVSATAAVTTLTARNYLKRHPGFLFDVEVRSGIEGEGGAD